MGPAENRDNRALMVTWNAPFASCVRSVTGGPAMPGEETFLCSSNAKREKTRLHNSSSCTLFMPLLTWSFPLKDTKNRFYEGEQLLLFL